MYQQIEQCSGDGFKMWAKMYKYHTFHWKQREQRTTWQVAAAGQPENIRRNIDNRVLGLYQPMEFYHHFLSGR